MKVIVNQETVEIGESADLAELLRAVNVEPERRGIAVAVNEQVVRRADWGTYGLSEDDRVEIIQATQGG